MIVRRTVLPVQSPSGLPIELVSSILRICGDKDRREIRLRKKEACCCGDLLQKVTRTGRLLKLMTKPWTDAMTALRSTFKVEEKILTAVKHGSRSKISVEGTLSSGRHVDQKE